MDKQIKCFYVCQEAQDFVEQFKMIRGGGNLPKTDRDINTKNRKVPPAVPDPVYEEWMTDAENEAVYHEYLLAMDEAEGLIEY